MSTRLARLLLAAAALAHSCGPAVAWQPSALPRLTPHRASQPACAGAADPIDPEAAPVSHMLETCKLACDQIADLVCTIYEMVGGGQGQGDARPGVAF
eukprot:2569589-Prymnesium_polylepis.1